MTSLTHDEIQELLGAYALDAVDEQERDVVELHLRECPRCRAEVAEHREVAALLAHGGTAAPDGVWDRIVAALDDTAPRMRIEIQGEDGTVVPLERPAPPPPAPASPWSGRLRVAVLGAAAALILLLGGLVVRLNDRLDELEGRESLQEVASSAVADPGSRRGMLELNDGAVVVPAAITEDGTGYLFAGSTPPLDRGLVYQLWGVNGDDLISLGTFEGAADVVPFSVGPGISALAVTEEDAPGVPQSEHDPIGVLQI
jgi:anti-sigma-K factor RskA/putative zinc finger protein